MVRDRADDGAGIDVEEFYVVSRAGQRVLVVRQRHEGIHFAFVQLEGALEGAIEEPHADFA